MSWEHVLYDILAVKIKCRKLVGIQHSPAVEVFAMPEGSNDVQQNIPAARLVAAAIITAAAIQTGRFGAGSKPAVAEYFNGIHRELFGTAPGE